MNNSQNIIDKLLNRITMYRLMLYYVSVLYAIAIILSFFKVLPYNFSDLIFSGSYLILISYVSNQLFALTFKVKPNYESQLITGVILALIVGPLPLLKNILFLSFLGVVAMASKYVIAYKKQHIFNPVAFAVTAAAVAFGQGASWWIGDKIMLPFIIIGGIIMTRKLRRSNLIFSFLISFLISLCLFSYTSVGINGLPNLVISSLLSPPLLFFTFVMLTEPITSPADKKLRMYFGAFAGLIYVLLNTYLGSIFYSLELSLLIANLAFRIIRFSEKYSFVLREKRLIANQIWEFVFESAKTFTFVPGQFLEWTLPHKADSRGNRRYLSIASSPTEQNVRIGIKIPEKASSFKNALLKLKTGDSIYATNLEGEFVLIKDPKAEYVFIAGGIGITPFRSILQYMIDKGIRFPVTLFYIAHDTSEYTYKDVFETATKKLGAKIVYVLGENPPSGWSGEVGRLNEEMLKKHVVNYQKSLYYISGPQPMTVAYKDMLKKIGINKSQIKTDFFPGYEETYAK